MVSVRLTRKLFGPLLRRHSDLEMVGHWIYVRPVRHIARGIALQSWRRANRWTPEWAAQPMFEPLDFMTLNWSEFMETCCPRDWLEVNPPSWDRTDDEQAAWLAEGYGFALPHLRALDTIEAFVAFEREPRRRSGRWPPSEVVLEAALGNFERVREIAAEHRAIWEQGGGINRGIQRIIDCARAVTPLVEREDRAGLAALFHDWEAISARNLGIEHIYEKTPFPFQENGGA
jgi:hypothetical protein